MKAIIFDFDGTIVDTEHSELQPVQPHVARSPLEKARRR
jgi:beta-phosphoglucomutase-like phosphatase (HAD superfamily)